MCLASCENRPQHTAHVPQTHQKFESLKIMNSRDDKIRFEFDELNAKKAEIVRIYFRWIGICENSVCEIVVRRKRQRTDGMKIDGRRRQEHQKEDKITTDQTDEDTKERQKDLEQEICVITWNVNKSSAPYDFLRDMAQCQANVVMFQETQNWQMDTCCSWKYPLSLDVLATHLGR